MMNKQNDAQRSASVKSPVNRRVWIALGALCIASFLGHLALFPQLPDIVPTHWDAAGNVNGWSSRMATLGLDLLPLGLQVQRKPRKSTKSKPKEECNKGCVSNRTALIACNH